MSAAAQVAQPPPATAAHSYKVVPIVWQKKLAALTVLLACAFIVVYFFSEVFAFGDYIIQTILRTNEGRSYMRPRA